jgi:NADH pyrophosphatase NudC (nudix superfamily)
LVIRCRFVSGEARVNDDESLDVGWFRQQDLPELMPASGADSEGH